MAYSDVHRRVRKGMQRVILWQGSRVCQLVVGDASGVNVAGPHQIMPR